MRFIRVRRILGFIAAIFLLSGAITITSSSQPQNAYADNNFLTTATIPEEYIPLFAGNSIPIWSPCGGQDSNDAECVAPTGDKITWIGDSYSVESRNKIMSELTGVDLGAEDSSNAYSPYYNIQYGKHLDWISSTNRSNAAGGPSGIDILKEIADSGNLRPYVVLALGTNDVVTEAETTSTLEKIADIVGEDTKVILTTAYTTNGSNYSPGNNAKKAFASTHDNFYVADWAAVAKPEYYEGNSTHPAANGGYDAWVETIVNTLPVDCGSGLLPGDDIPEKIWNWLYTWFKENNISGVDTSAVISGIMGNFWTESGFNPFMVGGGGNNYYGLWMKYWGYGGDELVQKVNDVVGSNYFKFWGWWEDENTADRVLSEAGVSQDAIDKAIDAELSILTRDWGGEFIPALTEWGVTDTPKGYSDLFLVTIERAVNGSDPIEDPAVRSHYGGFYQGASARREHAQYIYDKYAAKAGSNNSNSQSKSVSSSSDSYDSNSDLCGCNIEGGSSSTNISGGIDEAAAQKIADYYNDDSTPLGSGYLNGRKDNCVAFSGWFVANLTDLTGGDTSNPTSGDGRDVAANLASDYGLVNDTNPEPWSIFSSTVFHGDNHTGLVVGVEGDELITIEAEWWSESSGSLARVKRDAIPSGSTTYTHLNGHLDTAKISEIIGQNISGGSGSSPATSQISKTDYSLSTNASSISWDSDGWITGGMSGYTKEVPSVSLLPGQDKYNSGKPNKILLHYTQGTTSGLAAYGNMTDKSVAAHFTIDLLKKEVSQHYPIGQPSGAVMDSDDVRDVIQIEIVGYGFDEQNPDNPDQNSKCIIDGTDYTSSDYCFAKFSDEDWNYLATLLVGISKWGEENGTNIPLTSSVTWTGNTGERRLSASEFDSTTGIVAHMHAPDQGNHRDTGNIWPLVQAAISRMQCGSNGSSDSISGAKNADKQASEVGLITFSDSDTNSMKQLLENYGDLAYRTGQAYGVPWMAILVQARYEDGRMPFDRWCGSNNAWGIYCFGNHAGPGQGTNYANLGEGFTGYGETAHNGNYDEALKYPNDPIKYIQALQGTWIGTGSNYDLEDSINALQAYIDSPEGQSVVAQFGAGGCDVCNGGGAVNGDVLSAVQFIIDLANKNGSTYTWGGGHTSDSSVFDAMLSGSPINVDCTGFASLVMYKAYGQMTSFTSASIFSDPLYEEVSRSDVRPGDVFAYNSPHGHGGIVVEASNGVVTKIAETGGTEGRSGANSNIGYSGADSYSVTNMNSSNGHFFRWKGSK